MTLNITTNGTTPVELSPLSHYIASVEGTFDGAEVTVQSVGGVLYLPFDDAVGTVTSPNASEFRAISASAAVVVANAGVSTNLVVKIQKIMPSTRG